MGQPSSNPLIPTGYKELKRLGAGSFGVVVKCLKKDTKEIVALKIPQRGNLDNELAVMTFFERNNLDTCNIVRFIEPVTLLDNRTALAYESLDVTLSDYVNATACTGLNAHEVRSIVQQLASALNALESIKVIHADITFNNIMLVDRKAQPLRVKLIDFGLALSSSLVKQGLRRQVKTYRAPEVFLGLPFSESIDMWSLGVVMARLVLDRMIFPGITDYDVLQHIVDFLGVPSDHLLTAGMYSNRYFVKEHSSKWRLMTYEEFWGPMQVLDNGRVPRINYPDCLETSPMEQLNVVEAAEKEECIDLMKAMLRMDSNERITPSQVLAHPFIRRGNLHHRSDSIREASAPPSQTPSVSTSLEYKSWSGSDSECHKPAAAQIPPGVILVQPAPPECRVALAEDNRQSETFHSIREASAPPPQTPSVSTSLEYKSWSGSDSECHKPAAAQIPPGVILVQPAPPECRVALAEDNRQSETSRPLDLLEELSESSSVELPAHLAEGSDVQQEDTESTNITPVPQKRKKRTKKNPFKRLWDWAKETFTSRNSVDSES
ncbi:hypothetical protein ABVT39_007225 [Epinephelus coioides]